MSSSGPSFDSAVGGRLLELAREVIDLHSDTPIDLSRITLDADLYEQVGIDSLTAVAIVVEIQRRFRVRVPEAETSAYRSLRDFLVFIEREYYQ